jgi:predicted nucleotidyltransferase
MKDMEKIFERLRSETQGLFGEQLVSLSVFGSVATEDFHPGTSDINAVLVLTEVCLPQLQKSQELCRRLKKFRLAAPLVMTEAFIRTSADVFPIEFLEIKEKHRLLAGKDCFSRLKIDLKNLRHECEHELKGRLLRLRQSYMEVGQRPRHLQSLLVAAHNANYPAFRTALRLRKFKPPVEKGAILEAVAEKFDLDASVLLKVRQLRRGELRLGSSEINALFEKYSEEVDKLAQAVDRL